MKKHSDVNQFFFLFEIVESKNLQLYTEQFIILID